MRPPNSAPSHVVTINASGFTLVELLVVIGIIALLIALVIPTMSYGRFRAKVVACANNYRQWGIAVALYATEDGKGRLPSFPLPIESMTNYGNLEPWFVPFSLVTNMEARGITAARMYFCPVRQRRLEIHRENFLQLRGRDLVTPDDLMDEFQHVQNSSFASPDFFWWVPRRLGSSSVDYPDPKLMRARLPDPWPSTMHDPGGPTMPFISDWMLAQEEDAGFSVPGGGHRWGGKLRSSNCGFVDGRVETRSATQLHWQAESRSGSIAYIY